MRNNKNLYLVLLILTAAIAFRFGMSYASNTDTPSTIEKNDPEIKNTHIENIDTVWKKLNEQYYDSSKLDTSKLGWSAVQGFVEGIGDRYTVYMTPDESKDFDSSLDGLLEGIGAQLEVKDGKLIIVKPLKNSPAFEAGLLPGDIIEKINGEMAAKMVLEDAIKKIRGTKGTKVTLTIIRKGEKTPLIFDIVRREITIDSIVFTKLDGDIYHLELLKFNDHTKTEFENAIQKILLDKAKGLILDLRGNGGGYLDISIDILSELLPGKKPAVIIKQRDASQNKTAETSGAGRLSDIPLVVLVDNGSASASEIVAGAIQDYKRGVLIGEKTFGKGSVQEVYPLNDGSSLRYTIAKWFTPNGRTIDEVGIAPDKEVKFTEEDIKNKVDSQLNEAIKYLSSSKKAR